MQYLKRPYNDGSDSSEAQFTTRDPVDRTKAKQKWWETHASDWMPSVLQWKAIVVRDAIKEMFKPPSAVAVLEEARLTQPEPVGGPRKYTSFVFTSFSELFVPAANMATISMLLRDFAHFRRASDKTKIRAGVGVWNEIPGPDGKPFFDKESLTEPGELRLGVTYAMDW